MKVAFFETSSEEKKRISELLNIKSGIFFSSKKLSRRHLFFLRNCEVVSVFIYSKLDRKILSKMKKLKVIFARSTGFDHIDVDYCNERGIAVCNVPHYDENAVAEHVFSLLLAQARKLKLAFDTERKDGFDYKDISSWDLKSKTLGIIGFGAIGKRVSEIAQGFGMKVLVHHKYPTKRLEKEYKVKFVSFKKLLEKSDIVTLHVPLCKENYHLINKKSLKYFKKGSVLVNTSRGSVIDTDVLIKGLEKEIFSGLCLDVFEQEGSLHKRRIKSKIKIKENSSLLEKNEFLIKHPKVVATPHTAFHTDKAVRGIIENTAEGVNLFFKGKIKNQVNK